MRTPDFWAIFRLRMQIAMANAQATDARLQLARLGSDLALKTIAKYEPDHIEALEVLGGLDAEREEQQARDREGSDSEGGRRS